MSLQNATTAALSFTRCFQRPQCPGCGETVLLPEKAEFVSDGRILHTWACDDCRLGFVTAIDLNSR